jgi:hypothetical protein
MSSSGKWSLYINHYSEGTKDGGKVIVFSSAFTISWWKSKQSHDKISLNKSFIRTNSFIN